MAVRRVHVQIGLLVAAVALLFGVVEVNGVSAFEAVRTAPRHATVVGGAVDHADDATLVHPGRMRRLASFDAVLGSLFVFALWLSWPCAMQTVRTRRMRARFSIRRRGPPLLLAAG